MRRGAKAAAAAAAKSVAAAVGAVMEGLDQRVLLTATPFGATVTPVSGVGRGVALQVDAQGNLVAILASVENGSGPQTTVAQFRPVGTVDSTFGGGSGAVSVAAGSGANRVGGIAVDANGNIFVAGTVASADTDAYLVTVPPGGATATAVVMPAESATINTSAGSQTLTATSEAGRTVVIGMAGAVAGKPILVGDELLGNQQIEARRLQTLWPYLTGSATTVPVGAQHFASSDPTSPAGDSGASAGVSGLSAVAVTYDSGGVSQPGVVIGGLETTGDGGGGTVTRLFVSRVLATVATGDPAFGGDPVNGGAPAGSFRLTLPASVSTGNAFVTVAVDPTDGSIYVAEAERGATPAASVTNVYHLDATGKVIPTYGLTASSPSTLSATAHATVPGVAASGVAVDPASGRVYLVDVDTMTLAGLTPTGQLSALFSGQPLGPNEAANGVGKVQALGGNSAAGTGIAFADGEVVAVGVSAGNVALASAASPTTANDVAVGAPTDVRYDANGNVVSFARSVTATGLTEGTDYNVEYYLSGDSVLSADDRQVTGTVGNDGRVTAAVPADLGRGTYHVIERVVPVGALEQSSARENVAASADADVVAVTGRVTATPSYSATGVAAGTRLTGGTVSVTYAGQGSAQAAVQLVLRPVGATDASQDVALGTLGPVTVGRDQPPASLPINVTVPRSTAPGNYVVVAVVTAPAADAVTMVAGNAGPALAVTAAPAASSHLTIADVGGYPASLQANNALRGSFTVQNGGTAVDGSLPFEVKLRPVNGGADVLLGTATAQTIGADATVTVPFTIPVPFNTPTADYTVVIDVNPADLPVTSDVTNANGEAVGPAIHVARLRSTVSTTAVSYTTSSAQAGSTVSGTVTVKNDRGVETSPVTVGLFLRPAGAAAGDQSRDVAMATVDPVVVTGFTGGGGEARSAGFTAQIARETVPGGYVIVAKVIGVDEETSIDNPAGAAGTPVTVSAAPPIVSHVGLTSISYTATATVLGGTVTGTVKVQNTGDQATDPTSVRLVLRLVGAADASQDVRVGSVTTGVIQAGATASAPFGVTVPATVAPGDYQLVAIIPVAPNASTDVTTASVSGAAIKVTRGADLVAVITGPTGVIEGGKSTHVKVRIENHGDTAVNGKVVVVVYAVGGNLVAGNVGSIPPNAIAVGIKTLKVKLGAAAAGGGGKAPSTGTISFKVKVIDSFAALNPIPKETNPAASNSGRVRFMAVVNRPEVTTTPLPEADVTNNLTISRQSITTPAHVPDLVVTLTKVTKKGATIKVKNVGAKDANGGASMEFFAVGQVGGNGAQADDILLAARPLTASGKFKLVGGATKTYSVKFKPDEVVLGKHFVEATVLFGGDADTTDNTAVSGNAIAFT